MNRTLACNRNVFTNGQRTRHEAVTRRLLEQAECTELAEGWVFRVDRDRIAPAELAEWVAGESRCCPAIDFHLELPAFGPLTLRLGGGPDVKALIEAEIGPGLNTTRDMLTR